MTSQVQQVVTAVLLLLFGLLALRVWRRTGPVRRDRAALAWGLTAAYFLLSGAYTTVHSLLAAAGRALGRESALFAWVGSWAVAANLARGVLSVVFALLLLALLVVHRRRVQRVTRAAPAVLVATAVLATAFLVRFPLVGPYQMSSGLAVLSMLTAVVLMGALMAAVLDDSIDQLLWLALAVFALKETMSVSLFAVLAWWSLSPHAEAVHILYWGSSVLVAAMCGLAVRRLRLAGEGRRVPALFERLHALRRSPVS
jgi:hypothetical protein